MAAGPSLFRNGHNPVLRARNRPSDEKEIALCVDSDHPQADLGVALGTHVTGHPLTLDHPRGVGARADRAGLPVTSIAVGCRTTAESVAVHHTLETPSFGGAGNLDQFAR